MKNKVRIIFDVESIGLHGEGFAVGAVVTDEQGRMVEELYSACLPDEAAGDSEGRAWIAANVTPKLTFTASTPREVRESFWAFWLKWKAQGATLWADCCWPVEANFLSACVADDPTTRSWNGPYPLHEIATVFTVAGIDPTEVQDRLNNEPMHHPLGDARQSSRKLEEVLRS
jgi:hypothetical protein